MATFTEMGQMALSHLGCGKSISDIDEDTSEEARALRAFQEVALKIAMRKLAWPFCTEIVALALIEEDPNDEWDFSYRYPSTAISIRRILSGTRIDTRDSRVPYKVGKDSTAKLVFTDEEDAEAEVTVYVSDPSFYPEDFTLAFTYLWASLVAPRVTKGDPWKVKQAMLGYYERELALAGANAINEEQSDAEPDAESIRCRE
jgi:hypothetical protein